MEITYLTLIGNGSKLLGNKPHHTLTKKINSQKPQRMSQTAGPDNALRNAQSNNALPPCYNANDAMLREENTFLAFLNNISENFFFCINNQSFSSARPLK